MTYNIFTLSFTGAWAHAESAYQSFYFKNSLRRIRIVLIISTLFYAAFGLLDAIVVPELKYQFWAIRYFYYCPASLLVLWYSYNPKFEENSHLCLALLGIAGAFGIEAMIILADPPVSHFYYAGIILIFILLFTFFRIRFFYAAISSWIIVIFYEAGAVWMTDTPYTVLVSNNFFFISSNILCMFAGYSMELNSRKRFMANSLLEKTKKELTALNADLDERVVNRTNELTKSNQALKVALEREKESLRYLQQAEFIAKLGYIERNWQTGKGYGSAGLINLLGRARDDEVPGHDEFLKIIHPEDRLTYEAHLQESIQNHEQFDVEFRLIKKNGNTIHVHGVGDNYYDNDGTPLTTKATFQNVTDQKKEEKRRKQLEAQLVQTHKMEAIGTLAGGIAHDFNNILSGILGYSQLTQLQAQDPEKVNEHVEQIIKGAQRASDLTRQILTFSRQTKYQKHPFKIYIEIKEALKLLRSSIPTTIKINTRFDSRGMVIADPIKIHQLIMNLCTNAYHAMKEKGGVLTVALTDTDNQEAKRLNHGKALAQKYIKLEVSDTGHGMDEKILKRAFDPYYTTKQLGDGTGLGLSLVQAIVGEHDGFLDVCSDPDKGSSFYVYLPAVKPEPRKNEPGAAKSSVLAGTENIMVVDDEEAIRRSSKRLLGKYGYHVQSFADGLQAFDAFKAEPDTFDLIVTDLTMPELSGDKLAGRVLKIKPGIPIILCTGFSEDITQKKIAEIGIKKLVQKPVSSHDLAVLIRELLSNQD